MHTNSFGTQPHRAAAGPDDPRLGRLGRLGRTIRRAEQTVSGSIAAVLREVDLTVTQYGTLLVLSESSGLSGAQLARICLVTPQSMATVLARLAERGLVDRAPSAVHQKVLLARLSRSGRSVLRKADALVRPAEDRFTQALAPDQCECLMASLERIVTTLARD
jgi:DNA-binding MarR family transcriptional regulator